LITNKTAVLEQTQKVNKTKDLLAFAKFRLTLSVVISSTMGFGIAPGPFNLQSFLFLVFGGFLVTGAANGFNQVIERDTDKLMSRTQNRTLPTGRMSVNQGIRYATIMAILGLALLASINLLSAVLGFLALFIYVVIYTPLKKITPLAVFVGAFPGAIPPMLGYVAASGHFGFEPGILFAVQFIWQFPHFWAIAWVADDEYKKAGIRLLPSKNGRDRFSANQILLYTLFLIPISLLPWSFEISGWWSAIAVALLGLGFAWFAFDHTRKMTNKSALKIMFASFLYLPLVQLLYLLDKF
jgi:protoheme IX farnesyltransferase